MSINFTNTAIKLVLGAALLQGAKDYVSNCRYGIFNPLAGCNQYDLGPNLKASFNALTNFLGAIAVTNFLTSGTSNEFKLAAAGTCLAYSYLNSSREIPNAESTFKSGFSYRRGNFTVHPTTIVSGMSLVAKAAVPFVALATMAQAAMGR